MRFGFLGASRIGRRALAPAVLAAGHEVVAVGARDLPRAEAFAAEFGIARAYGDYAAVVADPAVEAVYIALTNEQHLPWTVAALRAGKHVLCEKPLALTAAEVAEMIRVAGETGGVVMEAFCHIFHPQFDRLRSLLAAGAVGRVLAMQASFVGMMEEEDFRWHAGMGGGALYDMGTYCVSLLRLLGGEVVGCSALRRARRGVDATLAGTLDLAGGAVGQFVCSFEGALQQHLLIRGSKGEIRLDWPISTKGRETTIWLDGVAERFAAIDPYVPMVADFVAGCGGGAMRFGLGESLAQARALDGLFAASVSA
jgi:predicted dehydrogenase